MSYHPTRAHVRPQPRRVLVRRGLGMPSFAPTTTFASGVGPWSQGQFGPRGAAYSPYGWGPDFMIGMPMNYTHHIDYVREPVGRIQGVQRKIGTYFDTLSGSGDGLGALVVL